MASREIDINKIAEMLTDDPDVFLEAKSKSPKVDEVKVDDKFEVHDGGLEPKGKPEKPRKHAGRKGSSLPGLESDEPYTSKKKSPTLKSSQEKSKKSKKPKKLDKRSI